MSVLLFWNTDNTMADGGLAFAICRSGHAACAPAWQGPAGKVMVLGGLQWPPLQRFTVMNIYEIALLVLTPLLVWRVYARLKAAMAPQRSVVSRHWTGLGVFLAMALIVIAESSRNLVLLAYAVTGLGFGIGWGVFAARRTRMEERADGFWFRPYARLGILVAMLFFARVLYVGFDLYAGGQPLRRLTDSPLTIIAMTVMAGYFGTISASLLRWRLIRD
jgi:hypothetical protein